MEQPSTVQFEKLVKYISPAPEPVAVEYLGYNQYRGVVEFQVLPTLSIFTIQAVSCSFVFLGNGELGCHVTCQESWMIEQTPLSQYTMDFLAVKQRQYTVFCYLSLFAAVSEAIFVGQTIPAVHRSRRR